LEDRSNSKKSNQTTFKTQFPLLRFVEVLFVAGKPKHTDLTMRLSSHTQELKMMEVLYPKDIYNDDVVQKTFYNDDVNL